MKKKIEDYIHYYPKCEVKCNTGCFGKINSLLKYGAIIQSDAAVANGEYDFSEFKILLFPVKTITVKEMEQVDKIVNQFDGNNAIEALKGMAAATEYLLKLKFDLFGLIESGIALDKTDAKISELLFNHPSPR